MNRKDYTKYYSTIKPDYKKKILMRGTWIAFLGLIPLCYGMLFMDEVTLSIWGTPIFFISLGLIAIGLLPYRKLTSLENSPHQLVLSNYNVIEYFDLGKKMLTIPFEAIESCKFIETPKIYGIGIDLKDKPSKKIIIHHPNVNIDKLQRDSRKKYHCDLFFPFFSQRNLNEIREYLQS